MGVKLKPAALLLALSMGLTGCVSTSVGKVPVNQDKAVSDYMNLAKGYVQGGYAEKAVKPLERALQIEPRSADVYGLLGMVYQIQSEAALAEKSFKTALSYNSDASDVRNNYGAFLFSQGRLSEAYRQFELASQDLSYPSRSRTFENMGIVALRQGKQSLATQHFEKALRLNSSLARANLELADIYFNQGNNRKSWQFYQSFIGLSQQDAKSLWLGIQLARSSGEKDKAASYALQLERLYPGSKELKEYRSRVGYEY
ncbi:type IV pilus biogenesis/stability protein PilW [Endozoicomonas sp. (ex Bugula neritina AB1)]|nr:type IV pilus biogenesis/stability protein PilW [Endozoicomonas sp. (ex Bugula neritina AB1)]